MSSVRGGVTATILGQLICRLLWHDWLPAGFLYRSCARCHRIERINRGGDNT